MQDSEITPIPAVRDIVLVGGGHSHVQVLKSWGMRSQPGVRLTLISEDFLSPYSGMLPGCLSGVYSADDIHIKLAPLCTFAQARLLRARVSGLDLAAKQVHLHGRPSVRYDVLSLNTGAVPVAPYANATTVKPISKFLPQWLQLCEEIQVGESLVIVGGGAGGVELAMAARKRLGSQVRISIVAAHLLPGHAPRLAQRVQVHLSKLDIAWRSGRAESHSDGLLALAAGETVRADHVLWVTQVQAPEWLSDSGLAVDEQGFVRVDSNLQSSSHPGVFAVGDVAHLEGQERAKSGVYAVRAGPVLTQNLRRFVQEKPLAPYRAQRQHLALIGDAHGNAFASRGTFTHMGRFWWWLKERIDWAFMKKFNELPQMPDARPVLPGSMARDLPEQSMRCGGCGAKIAADPLRRVLARLPRQQGAQVLLGIGDDAALISNPSHASVLTVDGFRAMIDDPYLFGRIVAHHSLNDIFAMGADGKAALVFVTVPLMAEALMEEELFQVLAGLTAVLNDHEVPLVGGHSAEGAELSVGLTVMGEPGAQTLEKGGAQLGDRLLLCKPIGTGVVLAAAMQGQASAKSVLAALEGMDKSNSPARDCFSEAGATAMTDITGFGLIGHLSEMLRASDMGAQLQLQRVPMYPGAQELMTTLQSSLQTANELALQDYELKGRVQFNDARLKLLADPQTSGGLLASVPEHASQACLDALLVAGYEAADIGAVTDAQTWVIAG